MAFVAVVANHPGCGITTILVNLAYGLTKKGCRVLIADLAEDEKLPRWLDIAAIDQNPQNQDTNRCEQVVFRSRLGIDYISGDVSSLEDAAIAQIFDESGYDFILANSVDGLDYRQLSSKIDYVMVCTNLTHGDELGEMRELERYISALTGKPDLIKLIIPNKINTKEWDHNSKHLFSLADLYGFEKIADPIPHCERVHDLPLQGQTVWELKQKNLQDAFNRLVEAVQRI